MAKRVSWIGLVVVGLFLAGCWSSKFTLIKQENAKVDRAYVGNWNALNSKGESATIIIRNVDDRNYYIEVHDAAKQYPEGVSRYFGFMAPVKDATFVHLREMQPDGKVAEDWILLRVELKGEKLTIRHLDEEFMKGKNISSAEELRKVLEQNLDDSTMYEKEGTITATKMVQ